ncbi:MAG: hypothetical protein CMM01_06665 [Rhodopirellula sp.]|nr:hypothetical protein [Rhodopirellula sp.]
MIGGYKKVSEDHLTFFLSASGAEGMQDDPTSLRNSFRGGLVPLHCVRSMPTKSRFGSTQT